MQEPTMPTTDAAESPELWEQYWNDLNLYELWHKNEKAIAYRKGYYLKKTEKRQIEKMKQLMEKYPDDAIRFAVLLKT